MTPSLKRGFETTQESEVEVLRLRAFLEDQGLVE